MYLQLRIWTNVFLGHIMSFSGYNIRYIKCHFPWQTFWPFALVLSKVRVQRPKWLFSLAPWCHAWPVCCSDIFWMILSLCQLPMLFLVSLLLLFSNAPYFYCTISILKYLLGFFVDHIPFSWNNDLYWHTCSFQIITDYDVGFIAGGGFANFRLLVPRFSYLTTWLVFVDFSTWSYECSLFSFALHFLAYVKV